MNYEYMLEKPKLSPIKFLESLFQGIMQHHFYTDKSELNLVLEPEIEFHYGLISQKLRLEYKMSVHSLDTHYILFKVGAKNGVHLFTGKDIDSIALNVISRLALATISSYIQGAKENT